MWFNSVFLEDPMALESFEEKFYFKIPEDFKDFLFLNNAATANGVEIQTSACTRTITSLLDFTPEKDYSGKNSAWLTNRRLRGAIGPKAIAFASAGNHYLCMQRNYRERYLAVWNYITQKFEQIQMSPEEFLKEFGR